MNSMMGYNGPTGGMSGRMHGKPQRLGNYDIGRIQQFTPEQQQLFSQLFSHVGPGSYLSRLAGGDQSLFEEQERPALRQFAELQGNIGSRFSGAGTMGARRSNAFQNSLNQAASNLSQDLASRRQGLQQQALRDLMGLSGDLLNQRPYETLALERGPSFLQSLLGGIGSGLGSLGGAAGGLFGLKKLGLF